MLFTTRETTMTKTSSDAAPTALATDDQIQLRTRLETAEADAAEVRGSLDRANRQLATVRGELGRSRTRVGQLERQIAGYNDEEFDPGKQKGVGAIPVGGDYSQIEAIEERLGMSPTMDQQMRALGLGTVVDQVRMLTDGDCEAYAEVVADADEDSHVSRALQALWKCRHVLDLVRQEDHWGDLESTGDINEALAAVDELPITLFGSHLDLENWDETGLPTIKGR
jgi:hypothetical protein